jgi:hypothetical protein
MLQKKFQFGIESVFLAKNSVLSFSTCSPPTLICMYALHNGAFYEQSKPKETK